MRVWIVLGILALVGCASHGPPAPQSSAGPAKPERIPKARRGFVPSSDMAWLAEMLAQRLEVARAEAWARFAANAEPGGDEEEARLQALVEPALRIGLPRAEMTRFYSAQLEAAAVWERHLRQQWRHPRNRPTMLPLSIEKTLRPLEEAVDAQILATLARLRGLPRGKPFRDFLVTQLRGRGIPPTAARIATAPFLPDPPQDAPALPHPEIRRGIPASEKNFQAGQLGAVRGD